LLRLEHDDNWDALDDAYEFMMDDDTVAEGVLLEARDMMHRIENKLHRRGKPERTLRKGQAWT
jgi:hypothetical protein